MSPLVSINDTDAAEFLASYASGQSLQDHDAQYVPRPDQDNNFFLLILSDITEFFQP